MKRKSVNFIGIVVSIVLLLCATHPVTAATNGGTMGICANYVGGVIDYDMYYNGTDYDPDPEGLEAFWKPDDVTFTLWLNATNSRPGLALDFIWNIHVMIENESAEFTVFGGDNSPATSNPESVSMWGMMYEETRNATLSIYIEGWSWNVWIIWELTIWEGEVLQDQDCNEWYFAYII